MAEMNDDFEVDAIALSRSLREKTSAKLLAMNPEERILYLRREAEKNETLRRIPRGERNSDFETKARPDRSRASG
jgi:hypothetical protein